MKDLSAILLFSSAIAWLASACAPTDSGTDKERGPHLAWLSSPTELQVLSGSVQGELEDREGCIGLQVPGGKFYQLVFYQRPRVISSTPALRIEAHTQIYERGSPLRGEGQLMDADTIRSHLAAESGTLCTDKVIVVRRVSLQEQ